MEKQMKDEYFNEAVELLLEKGKVSIDIIQRHFKIGYPRASRLIDMMEDAGIVSFDEKTYNRKLLITKEQYQSNKKRISN